MGPTRTRDLAAGAVGAGVVGYVLVAILYRWFPPVTVWSGVSLLVLALAVAGWAFLVRAKIAAGEIGVGANRLHPLTVARSVTAAKASAWVGAVSLGWWTAVVVYVVPRRTEMRVAAQDTTGAVVAALCALALVAAGLWLQHCCRSPNEPPEAGEASQ
jgi:hypothetical protein